MCKRLVALALLSSLPALAATYHFASIWDGAKVWKDACITTQGDHIQSVGPCTGTVVDLSRFTAMISDRPGGLADLAAQIASTGASIKQVVHDRAFAGSDVSAVHVLCTVETRNQQHLAELRTRLKEHGVETYDSK